MLGARLRFPPGPLFAPMKTASIDLSKNRNPFVRCFASVPANRSNGCFAASSFCKATVASRRLKAPSKLASGCLRLSRRPPFLRGFVECELGAALAEIAHLDVVVAAQRASGPYRATLRIDSDKRRGYIALPFDALDANIVVSALPKAGGEAITLEPRAAMIFLSICRCSLGSEHVLSLSTRSSMTGKICLPSKLRRSREPARTEVLAFSQNKPSRRMEWFCANPFAAGWRWRWRARADEAELAWSARMRSDHLTIVSSSRGGSSS